MRDVIGLGTGFCWRMAGWCNNRNEFWTVNSDATDTLLSVYVEWLIADKNTQ